MNATKRPEREISTHAEDVLKALELWKLPVDPMAIAKREGIELAPGEYSDNFDGRIKYLREVDTFSLAYRHAAYGRSEGRVRFSVAHELGHYYLHDDYLLGGHFHSSKTDFRSDELMEREADEFATNLLMPRELFVAEIHRSGKRFCILKDLCELAENRLRTSLTSTARRYCQSDIEACSVVFSENGRVRWSEHSEEMKSLRMGFIRSGSAVPRLSKTADLWRQLEEGVRVDRVERSVEPTVWYERPFYKKRLWEEAMPLGYTGIVLTYLTLEDPPE